MQASVTSDPITVESSAKVFSRGLDGLLDLSHHELAALYERATVPSLSTVRGDLRGRMLAVPALPDFITRWPRRWARTSTFPWRGKSFTPGSDAAGEGINRVVRDRWKLYRFTTRVSPSRHDGRPSIELDYDNPGNPFFIRPIEDEIRELAPGLYLGQAWLRTRSGKHFVLWFGLSERW